MTSNVTQPLDLVYMIKEDEDNEELRYSLRSLKNLPHRKVFFAGYKPSWVKNVEHIAVEQTGNKYDNIARNFIEICKCTDISDDFILMNDDFFIIKKIAHVPNLRRLKPLKHYAKLYDNNKDKTYQSTLLHAVEFIKRLGLKDIDSYEMHAPMVINRVKCLKLISMYPEVNTQHRRSNYGNYYQIGGKRMKDVKVVRDGMDFSKDIPFLSTIDNVFDGSEVGRFIMGKFTKKCEYER